MSRINTNHRILTGESRVESPEFSADTGFNLCDDTVFEFLSEEYDNKSGRCNLDDHEEDDENEVRRIGDSKDESFWEDQLQLLKAMICRTSSTESKIRSCMKEAVNGEKVAGKVCSCGVLFCRKCLMEEVVFRLQSCGFNTSICKSKWRNSPGIPAGEHTFLDVLLPASSNKKEVRVIIELNFRSEFEMARPNPEYDRLIGILPEIFVGKMERLTSILKILCAAAKKCMKEKKQHMGPWRKHRYMQAKWLTSSERLTVPQPSSPDYSGRLARPRMSLLTQDLSENFAFVYRPAAVKAA